MHGESVKMENFKFKFVQDNSPKGFFSSKGAITGGGLQLGDHLLPYGCVVDSTNRDTRLILQVDAASPEFPASLREKMWETSIVLEGVG